MTWFGHCITSVSIALKALPTAGLLMLISDLRDFLDRQEQEIHGHQHEAKTNTWPALMWSAYRPIYINPNADCYVLFSEGLVN